MREVFIKSGWAASFLGALCLINGQWAILQVIAWAGMLISYSAESGFEQGVQQTFDGNHPCELCHMVEEGVAPSNAEDQIASFSQIESLVAVSSSHLLLPLIPSDFNSRFSIADDLKSPFPEKPPIPPPRA